MTWLEIDTWIVLTASMVALACVLPGCFLFLSRQSMISHGIAHAVLPGIVIGHLATGMVETPALFIGAILAGVTCAVLTKFLQQISGVEEGAALGISFTTLFAIGLILQRLFADHVHIEPSHILMGNLETAIFDFTLSDQAMPETFWRAGIVLFVNLSFILLFFKELKLATFDPNHADTVEAHPKVMYYALMTISALTCVIAFEAVGSILVVAMMILPPAVASFFTKNLKTFIALSVLIALLGCALGHICSIGVFGKLSGVLFQLEDIGSTNTAGGITLVLCLFLGIGILYRKVLFIGSGSQKLSNDPASPKNQ